jgi:hypothetical protein
MPRMIWVRAKERCILVCIVTFEDQRKEYQCFTSIPVLVVVTRAGVV